LTNLSQKYECLLNRPRTLFILFGDCSDGKARITKASKIYGKALSIDALVFTEKAKCLYIGCHTHDVL
jgi:hypothetical protein